MVSFRRRKDQTPTLPDDVRARLELGRGERILAAALAEGGTWVVVTMASLYAVPLAGEILARPWHLVDTGAWDHDTFTLTVTWVDGAPPQQWIFRDTMQVLVALRERVQASVVLMEELSFGPNRTARVVIRKSLADQSLHDQTVLGRGVRLDDPAVGAAVTDARARLREQVGLD
ncbi:DNA primase [Nostocoides australiense Ben110]|uniref:DNA primase n=1 Tax=Nostocoides australiense Ben110 TaxID=1193182 RepID=W6JW72_9MICO|nr:hypothetical protein [Tetrasphaera australiensis]CCH72941.1 DNA primase [Tetrasphaera australiensis Ben110]